MIIGFSRAFGGGGSAPPTIEQIVKVYESTLAEGGNTTSAITVGSAANRVVLGIVEYNTSANTTNTSASSATFGGVDMTKLVSVSENGSGRRPRIAIFGIDSPASGSTTMTTSGLNAQATVVHLIELSSANQTLASYTSNGTVAASQTSRNAALTPVDNSLLVRALTILSGNYSSEIVANGSATLQGTGNTGATSTSDVTTAVSTEDIVTGGSSNTNGFSWTTSNDAADAVLNIPGV